MTARHFGCDSEGKSIVVRKFLGIDVESIESIGAVSERDFFPLGKFFA